jgi:hypothetical protein
VLLKLRVKVTKVEKAAKKELNMAKGVAHYFKDGTKHSGGMHKMPNGHVHSGARHSKTSKRLYHFKDLSETAKKKAKKKGK